MHVPAPERIAPANTPGWNLQKQRPNHFGYVERPLEATGKPGDEIELDTDLQDAIDRIDLNAVRPKELDELAWLLFTRGHISGLAWEELGTTRLDLNDDPINAMEYFSGRRAILKKPSNIQYHVARDMNDAAIDAINGIRSAQRAHGRLDVHA